MRNTAELNSRGQPRLQTINDEESKTVQSDAHLADINVIMHNFAQTGDAMLDEADLLYKDVSEFTDLQDALNQANLAESHFLTLPSKVREVFNHDVAVWLDTAHDQDKRDALVQAGFLEPPETTETTAKATTEPVATAEDPA